MVFSEMSAIYQDKTIQGKIKEKEEAKKEYEENKDKGNTVAYGSIYEDTKDIMNLKLANLGANQNLTIKLTYI